MSAGFYRAFEDRYRGSRELITQRLEAYLPFLEPLKSIYPDLPVLDIGCGRGEWLQLLLREGYSPVGVDLDEGMLAACQALQLPAHQDDALGALRKLPDDSQVVVSGFHIAEHVPFNVLEELVAEALRVLRPAGMLILETPNAENVMVGTNNFYLDPTHERPLPNQLLSFLTEHAGFARSKVVRLQEAPELRDEVGKIGVREVLCGASPDYAVIAQKHGEPSLMDAFKVFEGDYGVSLDQLAERFDRALEARLAKLEKKLDVVNYSSPDGAVVVHPAAQSHGQVEHLLVVQERHEVAMAALQRQFGALQERLQQAQAAAEQARANAESAAQERNQALENCHYHYLRAMEAEQQVQLMRVSSSWRFTAPLRWLARQLREPGQHGKASLNKLVRRIAPHARLWVERRPAVRRSAIAVLQRYPRLANKIKAVLAPEPVHVTNDVVHGVIDHAPLTPRGRTIESALRSAMKKS
ncbi:class I SAM-dependent methyltransferase [Pantoea sp. Ap-967]|uniref:class I SAM-dependent methyltransferase n=1 Tax=Pantoea sp. Ap-967 TaxID=2608362 RepID=UPI00141EA382|nr:class I SAM-dependent methyltransferase [Pantoea sp. Ap-967]NIE73937.1 class I SAM-dependent methyltransferase [Pantoea sp. Ap-967]